MWCVAFVVVMFLLFSMHHLGLSFINEGLSAKGPQSLMNREASWVREKG
jgi:hypothetical protein